LHAREPEEPYRPAVKRRLLDQVRDAIRARHMSPRTEEAYVHWIKQCIRRGPAARAADRTRWAQ